MNRSQLNIQEFIPHHHQDVEMFNLSEYIVNKNNIASGFTLLNVSVALFIQKNYSVDAVLKNI